MGIEKYAIVLFLLLTGNSLSSQEIILGLFSSDEGVMMRWYPLNYEVWQSGIEKGYSITRTIVADGEGKYLLQQKTEVLNNELFPLDSASWLVSLDTSNRHDAMAGATLHGEMNYGESEEKSYTDKISLYGNPDIQKHAFHLISINQSFRTAQKAGLAYVDSTAIEGITYRYGIMINQIPVGDEELITHVPILKPTKIEAINHTVSGNKVSLNWDHNPYSEIYASYDIYRSVGGMVKKKLNTSPVIPTISDQGKHKASYLDSIPIGFSDAMYSIKGVHLFDQTTEFSTSISVRVREELFPTIDITSVSQLDSQTIDLRYMTNDVSRMDLYYSERYDGEYRKISSIDDINNYTVPIGDIKSGYLYLSDVASDKNSNKVYVTIEDSTPPLMPTGLTCKIDSVDFSVVLNWDDNTDEDIYGYRAFASWSRTENFIDIGSGVFQQSEYIYDLDTRQNGETFYIQVAALDYNYNQSQYTSPCEVTMIDVRAPSPPLIRKIFFDEEAIRFEWARSPDQEATLHVIERVHMDSSEWDELYETTTTNQVEEYVDDQVQSSSKYYYRVKAIDQAGNFSYSPLVVGRTTQVARPIQIENLTGKIEDGKLILSWEFNGKGIDHWLVYGSEKDEWSLMKRVKVEETMAGDSFKFRYSFNENLNNKAFKIQGVGSDRSRTRLSESTNID